MLRFNGSGGDRVRVLLSIRDIGWKIGRGCGCLNSMMYRYSAKPARLRRGGSLSASGTCHHFTIYNKSNY
jgi:hypothetical protein